MRHASYDTAVLHHSHGFLAYSPHTHEQNQIYGQLHSVRWSSSKDKYILCLRYSRHFHKPNTRGFTILSTIMRVKFHLSNIIIGWQPIQLCHSFFRGRTRPVPNPTSPDRWRSFCTFFAIILYDHCRNQCRKLVWIIRLFPNIQRPSSIWVMGWKQEPPLIEKSHNS